MPLESLLPIWARRTHPLVRRHIHTFGATETPDISRLRRMLLIQIGLVAISLPAIAVARLDLSHPLVLMALLPVLAAAYALTLAAIILLPVGFVLYGRLLLGVSRDAASTILDERQNDTLEVLRTTPPNLRELLLGHIAGSIWRHAALLSLLLNLTSALSLPPIVLLHGTLWFPAEHPLLIRLTIIAGLLTSLIRPLLELVMAGALGTLAGATVSFRIAGTTWAALLLGAYFLLVNLPRLLPLSTPVRLLVEIGLPLALPPLITLGALAAAEHMLTSS